MCRRTITKVLIGLLLLASGLIIAAWLFPRQFLTVDSGPVKAEAIVVLSGAALQRPARAAELFRDGEAPLVICTGNGDVDAYKAFLVKSGVPTQAILLEPNAHTTHENATLTIAMLKERHIKTAIIVTSWYHSRRALMCFEHYAPDIKFYFRPTRCGSHKMVWSRDINAEYVKLLGYWARYGVCPL